jgi:AbrB family looped-hinge helix DNA binding protein
MSRSAKSYGVRLGRHGRFVIPAPVRKAMGFKPGDTLVCDRKGDRLIVRARREIEKELWERFAKVKGSLARELIAERHREARREAKK